MAKRRRQPKKLTRTPPVAVRRLLRREVGFGCPVPGCGNPYLEWNHFDPTWCERQHHNPTGMIALCAEHHAKADGRAFTKDQLREFKTRGKERANEVKGQFNWMRQDLLVVVGGGLFYDCITVFEYKSRPIIWFKRDEEGYLLLNVEMLTTSREPRARIHDNFWLSRGQPEDVESPPHGRLLSIKYGNGDNLRVEFFELKSAEALQTRYHNWDMYGVPEDIPFPITAVEVQSRVAGAGITFGAQNLTIMGTTLTGISSIRAGRAAISID